MRAHDHLSLRLVRLTAPDKWQNEGACLSFLFPIGGNGAYSSGSSSRPLLTGDICVLHGSSGGTVSSAQGEMVFWQFGVCLDHLFPLFASHEISMLDRLVDSFRTTKLYSASNPIAVECHKLLGEIQPQSGLTHRSQLLSVAARVLSTEFKDLKPSSGSFVRIEDQMVRALEQLSVPEILSLSVGELAARFSCSRRHLNRLFHEHFGFSVAALKMEMRLLKAINLLRNPDAKVINVAEQCGFNHLGLFNTCFKKRFGTSPGQWRKTMAEPQPADPPPPPAGDPDCKLRLSGLCPWADGRSHFPVAGDPESAKLVQPRSVSVLSVPAS